MENREKAGPVRASSKTLRFRPLNVVVLVPVLAVAVFWVWRYHSAAPQRAEYAARTATFSDSSERLKQTTIVPTLDTPLPSGRNVIWCSSFQLAWNELRDTVIGAPLEVVGAQEVANRLNAARESASDLDTKSVYAAGGWVSKGIREMIIKDMAAKFPSHTLPDFSEYADGILAYSYLTARVPFKHPFLQLHDGITFTDSQGVRTQVAGFGLWEAYLPAHKKICDQVEILYLRSGDEEHSSAPTEYVLDLCRHSKPYQVVVALVEPRGSLAETLGHVRTAIAEFKTLPLSKRARPLGGGDHLEIPEMFWRIDHRFRELIEKVVANSDLPMPIVEAFQTIEFRMDRSGVVLKSQSTVAAASALARNLSFNRPFLVYIQKRGAERPFFVMWVDNAELLVHQ